MGGIDVILLIVLGLVTWSVASEGIWGAALTSLIVVISGLLAMNFFEPTAALLEGFSGWSYVCGVPSRLRGSVARASLWLWMGVGGSVASTCKVKLR